MSTLLFLCLAIAAISAQPKWHELEDYTFEQYLKDFGKSYNNPSEFKLRKRIFEERVHSHRQHNSDSNKGWKQGVNQFTDRTKDEVKALYTGNFRAPKNQKKYNTPKAYTNKLSELKVEDFAGQSVDWRSQGVITSVKDQGRCGSCWSFAAAETVESYFALANPGQLRVLSEQQILDCTPNPQECGGTGGCGGATAELAFAQIAKMGGLSSEWTYPYTSYFGDGGRCNSTRFIPVARISGYTNLPQNKAAPILDHLLNKGPLAISVDASTWSSYEEGVFDGCNQTNPDLDHAVQLVGFGTDPQLGDYWLVRNSWAPLWGENGYIRLRRTAVERCGTDITPRDGDGCKDGPATEYVCGTCGIVYDALYPNII